MDIRNKLFIMSGLPGSGKSTLADEIAEQFEAIICSADDYFAKSGTYNFDATKLGLAHLSCRLNAESAMKEGYNVVIDNTNISRKDMKAYLDLADKNRYDVYVVRPNTAWANDPVACHKVFTHNVPLDTIKRMSESLARLRLEEIDNKYKVIHSIEEVESW